MSGSMSRGGLEVLDKSDLDLSQLIDHATSILKIDLATWLRRHVENTNPEALNLQYTFREQWVLRWLLRRLVSDQKQANDSAETTPRSPFLQHQPWMLLLYLLNAIPDSICAEILSERKFLHCLDQGLRIFLESDSQSPTPHGGYATCRSSDYADVEPPRKRRRLSSEERSPRPRDGSLTVSLSQVIFLVCCRCADIALSQNALEKSVEDNRNLAWSSGVQENASLFAASLEVTLALLEGLSNPQHRGEYFQRVLKLFHLWDSHPPTTSETSKANEVVAFNTYCISPCLRILHICTTLSDTHEAARACAQSIEKLLAIHTVLPLRTRFIDRHSKQWKRDLKCLAWQDIKPVYEDIIRILLPEQKTSRLDDFNMADVDWKGFTKHLYSITLRLIPKTDVRRKQWEKPWLDAFLCSLCYITCPALPKLKFTPPGTVEVLDLAAASNIENDVAGLSDLIQVAMDQHNAVSLQLLSYFASAVLSWDTGPAPWALISRLVALDVNIVIPGLGVPTTDYALDMLRLKTQEGTVNRCSYGVLRDDILLPVIRGFARSRALKDFVELWRPSLEEAMRHGVGGAQEEDQPTVLVWQDEDIFDEFGEMVHQYGTPSLIQNAFERLLGGISLIDSRSGSTLDIMANVAIFNPLLKGKGSLSVDADHLQNLQMATIAALHKHSDFQGQRWRLWSLIYHIQESNALKELPQDLLTLNSAQNKSLSITASEVGEGARSQSISQWRERLERFSLLAQQASRLNQAFSTEMEAEIQALQILTSSLLSEGTSLWSGRLTDLNNRSKFISACVSIIMSKPDLLQMSSSLTLALLRNPFPGKSRIDGDTEAAYPQLFASDLLLAFISSGMIESSKEVAERLCSTHLLEADTSNPAEAALTQDVVNALQLKTMTKSRLRAVAIEMFDKLSASSNEMSVKHLAAHLAMMERISSKISVSFCQADAWLAWVEFLNAMEKQKMTISSRPAHVVIRCVTALLCRVMASINDKAATRARVLPSILEWARDFVHSPQLTNYGLSRFLAMRVFVSTLCNESGRRDSVLSKKEVSDLSRSCVERITTGLHMLPTEPPSVDSCYDAFFMLKALSQLPQPFSIPEETIQKIRYLVQIAKTTGLTQTPESDSNCQSDVVLDLESLCDRFSSPEKWAVNEEWLEKQFGPSAEIRNLPVDITTARDMSSVAGKAAALAQNLAAEHQAEVLRLLAESRRPDGGGILGPCIIAAIILQADQSQLLQCPRLAEQLSSVASLYQTVGKGQWRRVLLDLENAKLALELHPKIFNQASIDALLSNISYLLSSASEHSLDVTDESADLIFNRICDLLGAVLGRFRRRLADRYHLLLAVLQQLLRCLFYPGSINLHARRVPVQGSRHTSFLNSLPRWLRTSKASLPPSSAEKYSRLLSSICNPTVSAAKSSRKRGGNALNDETKQVRVLAGQHMQYLVMEYARCSLDGEIRAQVKEKLMPGLYMVLEAMSRDSMRGMNAAMDPSSRAIFKTLYDDWTRYGKWDQT